MQISIAHLSKIFFRKKQRTVAYENLTFQIKQGEFFCILGPSGCGKTSLLRTIAGLETATSGELTIQPQGSSKPGTIGMVFQEHGLFPWMTIRNNIRFLLENNIHMVNRDLDAIVNEFIDLVRLTTFADYFPHQLSGGMRQRVSIARSFANEPGLLLMDEPFVFLDYQTRCALHGLLLDIWQRKKKTLVFVTHDIEEAVFLADRVLVMSAHPGTVKSIIDINLPRPREFLTLRKSSAYQNQVSELMELLREECEPFKSNQSA
ncbi:MAG: ABC transporter ATP-binding protein [Gammaproteobacteria bacterium]|nr:ABC transporter ATP-binding protein [Gammaproteobacteria bacterium]MCF6259327.1 ABC transporter ATP-binding protein [Gammaproteobacteria bacterium]